MYSKILSRFTGIMFPSVLAIALLAQPYSAEASPIEIVKIKSLTTSSSLKIISHSRTVLLRGRARKGTEIALRLRGSSKGKFRVKTDRRGRFEQRIKLTPGMSNLELRPISRLKRPMAITIAYMPMQHTRSFNGSPTERLKSFERLFPDSLSYAADLPARAAATELSQSMAELEGRESFSNRISLGLVFFGQFVDHDLDRIQTTSGQGPSVNPLAPLNIRTPALDLDSVYGAGPESSPILFSDDGLHFKLGKDGKDLLRDSSGKALIGDDRNDENGFIAAVHLSFQRYHNHLIDEMLHGGDANALTPEQKTMLFNGVKNQIIARYQGIVANQMSIAFSGRAIPDNLPPLTNIPIEFAGAVYRLGHTLVPQRVRIDQSGTSFSPVDPKLRGDASVIDLKLLFGNNAQPAAGFDDKIAQAMRELLIPLSPTDPGQGSAVGGNSPNIGGGKIIDGVLHLDLIETNLLRGRELKLASGEECFARIHNLSYQPAVHGNTDLFAYVLRESNRFGHLGEVGSNVFERTIGGILAADPYSYFNGGIFSESEIKQFRQFTMEQMLRELGDL